MPQPLVIVAAVNGGMQMSHDGAQVPITPEEIAEDARLCREAGAAIIHVHARDEQGKNSGDVELFKDIIRRIRERSDILIQTTNGIGVRRDPVTGENIWPDDDERLALVNLDPTPDLYGVAAGSTDFLHPEGGYHEETPYMNSPKFLKETIQAVYKKSSTLEYEIVDTHALHRLSQYADDGLLDRDADYIWLLFGGGFCFTPSDAEYLGYLRRSGERLFPNALWGVIGGGHHNYEFTTLGISMGATTARLGFEDGVYLPDGRVAERNHHLVEKLVDIARIFGREPATPEQARQIMGLNRDRKTT
jgi:3-keto-5-aminohexanoate cleavage enzyme